MGRSPDACGQPIHPPFMEESHMPRFGSLRGKMLALILTPIAAAIVLMTVFAISRASSDQRKSAFAELEQRTQVESLKVDQTVGGALATANAAAAILGG